MYFSTACFNSKLRMIDETTNQAQTAIDITVSLHEKIYIYIIYIYIYKKFCLFMSGRYSIPWDAEYIYIYGDYGMGVER